MVKDNWAKGAQKGDKRKRLDDDDGTKTQLGLAVLDACRKSLTYLLIRMETGEAKEGQGLLQTWRVRGGNR